MLAISVTSHSFNSDFLKSAISLLLSRHQHVLVLIVDELMVYNRFQLPRGGADTSPILAQYRGDRERQLEKILATLDHGRRVQIGNYEDFCDYRYVRILRRLMLLAIENSKILGRLKDISRNYVMKFDDQPREFRDSSRLIRSLLFLLDETAWTMNLAAHYGVTDNYYPGDVGEVLKAFYCNEAAVNIFDVLDIAPHAHRFWRLNRTDESLEPELMWQAGA